MGALGDYGPFGFVDVVEDTPAPLEEDVALVGQAHAAGRPVNEGRAEAALEPRDDPADHGLAEPERRCGRREAAQLRRSEEHTSELQSLMRISYAVLCLNKKQLHKITN